MDDVSSQTQSTGTGAVVRQTSTEGLLVGYGIMVLSLCTILTSRREFLPTVTPYLPLLGGSIALIVRSCFCYAEPTQRKLPLLKAFAAWLGGVLLGAIPLQFLALIAAQGRASDTPVSLASAILIPLVILGIPGLLLLYFGFRRGKK